MVLIIVRHSIICLISSLHCACNSSGDNDNDDFDDTLLHENITQKLARISLPVPMVSFFVALCSALEQKTAMSDNSLSLFLSLSLSLSLSSGFADLAVSVFNRCGDRCCKNQYISLNGTEVEWFSCAECLQVVKLQSH